MHIKITRFFMLYKWYVDKCFEINKTSKQVSENCQFILLFKESRISEISYRLTACVKKKYLSSAYEMKFLLTIWFAEFAQYDPKSKILLTNY